MENTTLELVEELNKVSLQLDAINQTGVTKDELLNKVVNPMLALVDGMILTEQHVISNIRTVSYVALSYFDNSRTMDMEHMDANVNMDKAKSFLTKKSIDAIVASEKVIKTLNEIKEELERVNSIEDGTVVGISKMLIRLLDLM